MNKQRMIKMLNDALGAVTEAGLTNGNVITKGDETFVSVTEGTQNLVGQLILAASIEESGSSIGMSLDKLEQVAQELGEIASSIKQH